MSLSTAPRRVVAVDLDGTLVNSDLLAESVFLLVRRDPLAIFRVVWWLLHGKVHLKRKLAESVLPEFSTLPYNKDVLNWLKEQKAGGAFLVLATASEDRVARGVSGFLDIFDDVVGTREVNLASRGK